MFDMALFKIGGMRSQPSEIKSNELTTILDVQADLREEVRWRKTVSGAISGMPLTDERRRRVGHREYWRRSGGKNSARSMLHFDLVDRIASTTSTATRAMSKPAATMITTILTKVIDRCY